MLRIARRRAILLFIWMMATSLPVRTTAVEPGTNSTSDSSTKKRIAVADQEQPPIPLVPTKVGIVNLGKVFLQHPRVNDRLRAVLSRPGRGTELDFEEIYSIYRAILNQIGAYAAENDIVLVLRVTDQQQQEISVPQEVIRELDKTIIYSRDVDITSKIIELVTGKRPESVADGVVQPVK